MNTQGLQAGKSLATGRFASGAVALAIVLASAPLGQALAQEQTSAEEAWNRAASTANRIWAKGSNPNLLTAHAAGPCCQDLGFGIRVGTLIP